MAKKISLLIFIAAAVSFFAMSYAEGSNAVDFILNNNPVSVSFGKSIDDTLQKLKVMQASSKSGVKYWNTNGETERQIGWQCTAKPNNVKYLGYDAEYINVYASYNYTLKKNINSISNSYLYRLELQLSVENVKDALTNINDQLSALYGKPSTKKEKMNILSITPSGIRTETKTVSTQTFISDDLQIKLINQNAKSKKPGTILLYIGLPGWDDVVKQHDKK